MERDFFFYECNFRNVIGTIAVIKTIFVTSAREGRDGTAPAIIDMIHKALTLWSDQEYNKLDDYLQSSGAGTNETFRRVAQAAGLRDGLFHSSGPHFFLAAS